MWFKNKFEPTIFYSDNGRRVTVRGHPNNADLIAGDMGTVIGGVKDKIIWTEWGPYHKNFVYFVRMDRGEGELMIHSSNLRFDPRKKKPAKKKAKKVKK